MTKKTTNNIDTQSTLRLSVQVSLNGLSFSVLDSTDNSIVLLHNKSFSAKVNPIVLEQKLKEEFLSKGIFNYEFSHVSVVHQNNIQTFVPKVYFDESLLADYLKFNTKLFESDYIVYDCIDELEIVSVYVPFININNYILELFGEFTYHHSNSIFIDKITEAYSGDSKVFCMVNHNNYDLLIVNNKQLVFNNNFSYSTPEDFIYYILFVFEQLNLDTDKTDLIFLGNVGLDDAIYLMTYKYIRHVSFGSRNKNFIYKDPEEKPKYGYDYFTLLNAF